MNWDLEERTEDAVLAYLKPKADGMNGYTNDVLALEFPCFVVFCVSCGPLVETGRFAVPHKLLVEVAIMTEAAPLMNASDTAVDKTARDRHRSARSVVMAALNILDSQATPAGLAARVAAEDLPKGLAAEIDALAPAGVWISNALVGDVQRTIDAEHRLLISTIPLEIIAQPTEIGGTET